LPTKKRLLMRVIVDTSVLIALTQEGAGTADATRGDPEPSTYDRVNNFLMPPRLRPFRMPSAAHRTCARADFAAIRQASSSENSANAAKSAGSVKQE
jgi:hypothetical protein